jgi:N-acetylmuramoyl-L-alanine amidase
MFYCEFDVSFIAKQALYVENVSVMKKLLLIICIGVLLASFPLFAQEKKEVLLRFSQQDNIMRVVLESDDSIIKNANIIATLSGIKIEFPAIIDLKKQKDFIFDISSKDRFLSITLKNVEDVVSYRLTSPSRIVIDLRMTQKLPIHPQAQTVDKPKQEAVKIPEKTSTARQEAVKVAEKPIAARVIFLDAGHGGYDYGLISKDAKEKDLNLLLIKDLNTALSKKGDKVFLTRKVDQSLSIIERITLINSRKSDIFISIHSSDSRDFVIYTATVDEPATESPAKLYSLSSRQGSHIEKSRALAKALGQSLKTEFKGDVIIREMPLPILQSMDSSAVLIEYPSLQLNTYDQKMRDRLVNAVLEGISPHE